MSFKSRFYATAALVSLFAFAPFASTQAGQLFPPANIGKNPNVTCPNGQLLGWTGDAVACADPTPGVTVSCPSGDVLTGITNGVADCVPLPTATSTTTTVSSGGGSSPPVTVVTPPPPPPTLLPYPSVIMCDGGAIGFAGLTSGGAADATYTYTQTGSLPFCTCVYDAYSGNLLEAGGTAGGNPGGCPTTL